MSCARAVVCTVAPDQAGAECLAALSASYADGRAPISRVLVAPSADGYGGGPYYPPEPSYGSTKPSHTSKPGHKKGKGGSSGTSPGSTTTQSVPTLPGSTSVTTVLVSVSATPTSQSVATSIRLSMAVGSAPPVTMRGRALTGQIVRLIATVTPVPNGGTVRFTAQGIPIPGCRAVPVDTATGQAVCRVRFARAGRLALVAAYSGDSAFSSVTSAPLIATISWSLTPKGSPRPLAVGVTWTLACSAKVPQCATTVTLLSHSGHTQVGQTRVTLLPGQTRTVTVNLNPAGRRLLARQAGAPVDAILSLTTDGEQATVTSTTVALTR